MIVYATAETENDLKGILNLQKANLTNNLSPDEIKNQGFVTISHSFEDLKKLNEIEKHIVAKDEDKVIAYLLAMTAQSKDNIPILFPMFEIFNKISFAGILISNYHYILVGQVCIAKDYRGKGILDRAYYKYKDQFEHKYDFAITEIAITNPRSINAHKRIGFKEIYRYKDPGKTEWVIVLWDWKVSSE
jgi:GNAT superfamily N-acetyltransferase